MASNDSTGKTLMVALVLCIVCSVIVSTAAVMLRPAQLANKALDRKQNILAAAGLLREGVSVDEQFASIETRVVNLDTGEFADDIDADSFDQRKAADDSSLSVALSGDEDLAKISRRENYSLVYLVREGDAIDKIILPVHGYGLWSTLYGFLALEADANTVVGLGFYEHKETPGLGGEVDNPRWKAMWPGKQVYDSSGNVALSVIKGNVNPASSNAKYEVDGLSGATLTSKGVSNLVHFWLDENGFKPFLEKLRKGGV